MLEIWFNTFLKPGKLEKNDYEQEINRFCDGICSNSNNWVFPLKAFLNVQRAKKTKTPAARI